MVSPFLYLFVLSAARISAFVLPRDTPSCKTTPGAPGWPSADSWARLNETTGGRLLSPTPPGAVCHKGQPTYNAARCTDVQNAWPNDNFHTNDPISVEWNNWTNDTCIPIPGLNCSASGYPVYVINATTAAHVKIGIDFGEYISELP